MNAHWVATFLFFLYPFLVVKPKAQTQTPLKKNIETSNFKIADFQKIATRVSLVSDFSSQQKTDATQFWSSFPEDLCFESLFNNYAFKAWDRRTQLAWLRYRFNEITLHLHFNVVEPIEILKFQSQGHRCISTLLAPIDQKVAHRDLFQFCLHDLEHAGLFFKDEHSTNEQSESSKALIRIYVDPIVNSWKLSDDKFAFDLNYICSDMNTPWPHTWACLKAATLERLKRRHHCSGRLPFEVERFFEADLKHLLKILDLPSSFIQIDSCLGQNTPDSTAL